jgi:hypothetical protein
MELGRHADFYVLFFFLFLGGLVSGLMQFRNGADKGTASGFVQNLENVRWRPWQ